MNPLVVRLFGYLAATHAQLGYDYPLPDAMRAYDIEVHGLGETGVLGFDDDYLLIYIPPAERVTATRQALDLIRARLERGPLKSVVYFCNFPSIRTTRKLGGRLLGVDEDRFFHYEITRETFRYGQAKST